LILIKKNLGFSGIQFPFGKQNVEREASNLKFFYTNGCFEKHLFFKVYLAYLFISEPVFFWFES